MSDRIGQKLAREKRVADAARAFPKGPTRKTLKAKKKREERTIIGLVRSVCALRDGHCRLGSSCLSFQSLATAGPCAGQSEWAHFGRHRRARTRGMVPEDRHTPSGSLQLCTKHHRQYDAGTLKITALTDRGCDGPLEFTC